MQVDSFPKIPSAADIQNIVMIICEYVNVKLSVHSSPYNQVRLFCLSQDKASNDMGVRKMLAGDPFVALLLGTRRCREIFNFATATN